MLDLRLLRNRSAAPKISGEIPEKNLCKLALSNCLSYPLMGVKIVLVHA